MKKNQQEVVRWIPFWTIRKFVNEEDYKKGRSYEISKFGGNALTTEGINELWTIIGSAASGTKFDNTHAYLIVGTGTGEESQNDTEATFTNGVKKPMNEGYPTYGTDRKITFKSTYDGNSANQAWNEFGVLNAATGGKLLNRKVSAQGTKTAGQVWELELEITLA